MFPENNNDGWLTKAIKKEKWLSPQELYQISQDRAEEKRKQEGGLLGFVADNLAAGTGGTIETVGNLLESATRPDSKTPTEWHGQVGSFIKGLQNTGREMRERNTHYYEPHSTEALVASGLQSLPEMAGDMLASWAAGTAAAGPAGALAATGKNIFTAGKWGKRLYDAYQGTSNAAKLARTLTPRGSTVAATGVGTTLEALSEGQRAADDYIAQAKANGSYIPNKTELEAESLRNRVFRDNIAAISGINAAQYGMTFGKLGKGHNLARLFGTAGSEAVEEYIQGVIPKAEQGQTWHYDDPDLIDSAIVGGALGGLVHGAGRGLDYLANRNNPPPQPESVQDIFNRANYDSYQPQEYSNLVGWAKEISGGNDATIHKVIDIANEEGVSPRLALAVGIQESGFNQNATSPVGAIGVMQLMPETAEGLGVDPHNEEENIRGGIKYLKQMLDKFDGNEELALAAYNAGEGAVQRYGGIPPYDETQNYVANIMAMYESSPRYNGGNQSEIYTGENGQAEGKYWNRQNDGVSFEGAQPDLLNAVDMLSKWYFERTGKPFYVTAGTNGDHPSNGSEHGHDAGWKVDINDSPDGVNVDGYLLGKNDGEKGSLTDEFIAYGRSLGLGMNWEGDHIDVALDGNQWDGNGENAGGFNPSNISRPAPSPSRAPSISTPQTESPESTNRKDEPEEEYQPIDFSDGDETTQNLFDEFLQSKKNPEGENLLANLFNEDGEFINTQENRDEVQEEFGEEFDKFLHSKGYRLSKDETAPKAKTQEQPKPEQGQVEFEGIKPPAKKYLGNAELTEKIRQIQRYASEKGDTDLLLRASSAEGNVQEMQEIVDEVPLPKEFAKSQETKKPKVEIPADVLATARAEVSDNAAKRAEQGQALLKIAKLNKFAVDSDLKTAASKGYSKAIPQLKALLEKQGFLNGGKESTIDRIKKLSGEFSQKQIELDDFHRESRKVVDGNDKKASREALSKFRQLRQEQEARRKELTQLHQGAIKEWRGSRNAPKSDYRKMLADYQNEVEELTEETENARKKTTRLFRLGDFDAHQKALAEYKNLQKQLDDKIAERDKFSVSADYRQDLVDEFESATEKRKKEILDTLIKLDTPQNSQDDSVFIPKPQKFRRKPPQVGNSRQVEEETPAQPKTEQDYQDEIQEISNQMKTVREQGLKSEGEERKAKQKEFKALEQQKKTLTEKLNAFKKSSAYLENLREKLADVEGFIEEGEKNTKLAKQRDTLQKEISELEKSLGINRTETSAPEKVETPQEVSDSAKNKNFDDVQRQTKQILGNIHAQESEPKKSETPPTSKKTYRFDGTENQSAEVSKMVESDQIPQSEKMVEDKTTAEEQIIQSDKTIEPAEKNSETKKDKRVVKKIKEKADQFFKDFSDGKVSAAQTNEKLEKLANRTDDNQKLTDEEKADVRDYIDELKADLTDYSHGEKDLNVSENESTEEKPAETKKALADLAEKSWNDKNYNGKVSFTPSKKFRDKVQELFGHDVNEVFITSSDIRHIQKHHGENEEQRGQVDMTPETISEIYDVVNDFDSATKERNDKQGNQNIMLVKGNNGTSYAVLIERGKSKAQVKTAYKKKEEQVLDVTSPKPNVQNDPALPSEQNISQSEEGGKNTIDFLNDEWTKWYKDNAKKLKKIEVGFTTVLDETAMTARSIKKWFNHNLISSQEAKKYFQELLSDPENFVEKLGRVKYNAYNTLSWGTDLHELFLPKNTVISGVKDENTKGKNRSVVDITTPKSEENSAMVNRIVKKVARKTDPTDVVETETGYKIIWEQKVSTSEWEIDVANLAHDYAEEFVEAVKILLKKPAKWNATQNISEEKTSEEKISPSLQEKIKQAGLEDVSYDSEPIGISRWTKNRALEFRNIDAVKKNVSEKDLQNVIKLAEFYGGKYDGKSAITFTGKDVEEINGKKSDFHIALQAFMQNKHLNPETKKAVSVEENIANGEKAIEHIMENHNEVQPAKKSRFSRFSGESATSKTDSAEKVKTRKFTKKEISEKLADFIEYQINIDVRPFRNSKYEQPGTLLISWEKLGKTQQSEIQMLAMYSAAGTFKVEDYGGLGKILTPTAEQISRWNSNVEKNISDGRKAIRRVLDTKKDVIGAVYRDDVGYIDFVYGTPGKGENFNAGYGISHIVAKRNAENGKGVKIADKLAEVIARGTETERQQSEGNSILKIHYDNYTAVLSSPADKKGKRGTWVWTGEDNNQKPVEEKPVETKPAEEQSENQGKEIDKEKLYRTWQVDKFPEIKSFIDNDLALFPSDMLQNPSDEEIFYVAHDGLDNRYPTTLSPRTKEYDRLMIQRVKKYDDLKEKLLRKKNPISLEQAYQEYEKFLQKQTGIKNSKTFDNENDEEEKELIKTILNAPVGTKIISRNGVAGEGGHYEITERGGEKVIAGFDADGSRSNRQPVKLNRANVKKLFGAGRVYGEKLRTGKVTVILPENESFEVEGDPDVSITDDMIVAEKNLTSQQKTFVEIGNELGLPVKFFKGDPKFKGVLRKGTSYINVNNKNFEQTFWHETAHYLSNFNPEMFDEILEVVPITEKQLQAVRDKSPHYEDLSDRQLKEEILADNFMDFSKRAGLLQEIGKQDKNLAERFISWLKSLMDKFTSFFSNPKGGLTRTQREAMYNAFNKNVRAMVDGNGNKLFRVSNVTGEIQKFNGEKLPAEVLAKRRRDFENAEDVYSIEPSDNSNEGWTNKIGSYVSTWWKTKSGKNERFNQRLSRLLSEVSEFKILQGHFDGDESATIDLARKVIRVQNYYDWENLLPKVGRAISQKVNLPQSEKMDRYIADWLSLGAVNNTSEESRMFAKAMRENPATFEGLQEIQSKFQELANMSAEKLFSATITDRENKKAKSPQDQYREFYRTVVDDKAPLKFMVEDIEEVFGKKIAQALNPHFQAAMAEGADGLSRLLIETRTVEGAKKAVEALKLRFPLMQFKGFKPLGLILEEAGGFENVKKFGYYLVAKQEKELHEKNRQEGYKKYYTKYTEEKCDEIISNGKEQFDQAQKDFVVYANTVMTMLYDSGVISKKQYQNMMKSYKNFAPLHRVFDEEEEIDFADSLKKRSGGGQDIVDPIQVMAANTVNFIRAAERNKVKLKLAMLARCEGYGQFITEEESQNTHDPKIAYRENGKKKYLVTTDAIAKAVKSLTGNREQTDFFFSALKAATSIQRSVLTSLSLDFSAGNPFRDVQEAYLYNKQGGLNPLYLIKAVGKGFWRVLRAMANHVGLTKKGGIEYDEDYQEFLAMGGSQASMVSVDINTTKDVINNLTKTNKEKWRGSGVKGFFSQILRSMQSFSEELENSTRLEVYRKTKARLASKRPDGKATLEDMRRAAYEARNATIDFARGGSATKKANQYVAFLNAVVQSWDKNLRLMNPAKLLTKEGRNDLLDTAFRLTISTLPLAILQGIYSDDDWYKYGVQDWQKDTSWIVLPTNPLNGEPIKIPKSYDLVTRLAGTIFEDAATRFFSGESLDGKRYRKIFTDSLPAILPSIISPSVEAATNYSFFYGGSLVPKKELNLPAHMQYGAKTNEFAKWFGNSLAAKTLSEIFFGDSDGFSPRKIDHLIDGYFGFPGKAVNGLINFAVGDNYSFDSTEFPMTKRFTFDPYKNPQIVQDYYNVRSEQERLSREYKENRRKGINEKPDGYDEKLYKRIKANESAMKKVSLRERKLLENKNLPADELQRQLRELEEIRIKICKRVFDYK